VVAVFGLLPIFVYCCTGPALCLALDSFCRGCFFSTTELASVCSLVRSSFLLLLFSESVQVSILSSGTEFLMDLLVSQSTGVLGFSVSGSC
jgi:hypothetical protein